MQHTRGIAMPRTPVTVMRRSTVTSHRQTAHTLHAAHIWHATHSCRYQACNAQPTNDDAHLSLPDGVKLACNAHLALPHGVKLACNAHLAMYTCHCPCEAALSLYFNAHLAVAYNDANLACNTPVTGMHTWHTTHI
jgi:hypothetical protein